MRGRGKMIENMLQIGNPQKNSIIMQLLLGLKIIPGIGLNEININHEVLDRWKLKEQKIIPRKQ